MRHPCGVGTDGTTKENTPLDELFFSRFQGHWPLQRDLLFLQALQFFGVVQAVLRAGVQFYRGDIVTIHGNFLS
jgi:hypothetical protein